MEETMLIRISKIIFSFKLKSDELWSQWSHPLQIDVKSKTII